MINDLLPSQALYCVPWYLVASQADPFCREEIVKRPIKILIWSDFLGENGNVQKKLLKKMSEK
jgi:hypothetical protein